MDEVLRIQAFGNLTIRRDGIVLGGFTSRKVEALLVYLACTRQPHSREFLAELLWQERPQAQSLNNLRQALFDLRHHLAPYISVNRQTVALSPHCRCWLDVAELEGRLHLARQHWTQPQGLSAEAAQQLEQALGLYQGDFLAGFYLRDSQGFEDWMIQERERLRRAVIEAWQNLVAYALDKGAYSVGIAQATRLLRLEPLLEEGHRQLMQLLVKAGQRSAALAQYESCRRLLKDELGVEPMHETVALYEQIRAGELAIALNSVVSIPDVQDTTAVTAEPRNPYKGLRAFQESDAADFFGREALVERLLTRLNNANGDDHFLAVIGPSGSGKSSVVKAGLIPAFRQAELRGSGRWFVVEMLPGEHPFEELEVALLRIAANPPISLLAQLREDERGLLRAIKRVLPDDKSQLLLVIDQFEEVFTLVTDETIRCRFLDSLLSAVSDPRSPLQVVITLRADFYDRPLRYLAFGNLLHRQAEVVLPLSHAELERAVVNPAMHVGLTVEHSLVTAIITNVSEQPGALPLLQFALTELFERRQGNRLTVETYQATGGVSGALARRADEVFEGLAASSQEIARQLFLRLITLGEGIEDTRRRIRRSELDLTLDLTTDTTQMMSAVIEVFSKYRLLTLDRDPMTGGPTVEVAHEALIQGWARLRGWLDESRENLRVHRRLTTATAEWMNAGRDASYLATGMRLAQFEALAAGSDLALNRQEREYLQVSIAERTWQEAAERDRQAREKALERRSVRILRVLVIVLILATLGALGLTGIARNNAALAERNAAEARSLALASGAQLALNEGSIDQAIALAKAAQQVTNNPPPLAELVLDEAAYAPGTRRIFRETEKVSGGALSTSAASPKFVMVSHMIPQFFFAALIVRGMQDACDRLNASCQWLNDPVYPYQQVAKPWKQALTMNPDGIGTSITDPNMIRSYVQQAAERGIPVVAYNVADAQDPDPSLPALLYIGSDEFLSGVSNARRVFAEARADGVTIRRGVCARQVGNNPALAARCAGVKSVFDEQNVPLDQIRIRFSGNNDEVLDLAVSQIADYFKAHPETRAIFMLGPSPASALHQYIQQAGLKPRQLYATTHDTSPEIFQMIRDGYLLQTIDQQPYMQGFQTIMSLYLYHQYGLRPSGFINTSSVVDQSNVDLVTRLVEAGYR